MQELVAGVEKIRFDLETDVEQQRGARLLPFPELGAAACEFFRRGLCSKGLLCPFRHVSGDRTVVCKHWLRGLCKRGDQCDFLHEYDVTKMPMCYFYSKFGECSNKECPFLHIDATSRATGCPWYDRGFCKHGPLCKYRHTRRVLCTNYLVGFCPEGPKCRFMHLKAGLMCSMEQTKAGDRPRGPAQGSERQRPEPRPAASTAEQPLGPQRLPEPVTRFKPIFGGVLELRGWPAAFPCQLGCELAGHNVVPGSKRPGCEDGEG
ncbi:putative cleavage and polyadenylation specificity factor subunit 4-like protein [Nothoprocta perdicaria]|uniref:putative cleavage and polyadenylation specificity factor subunit 4-like protein n=1 Tax=Nothoprocta perdicaria TaxID=30464 RepID=UPI000E1B5594|nr:putative cleavage and polyadenylation specificity factor subunit 4-like protein [Nothoprocta perdicaria]